jgi:phosphoribosyl-AMP cyclohydrolase
MPFTKPSLAPYARLAMQSLEVFLDSPAIGTREQKITERTWEPNNPFRINDPNHQVTQEKPKNPAEFSTARSDFSTSRPDFSTHPRPQALPKKGPPCYLKISWFSEPITAITTTIRCGRRWLLSRDFLRQKSFSSPAALTLARRAFCFSNPSVGKIHIEMNTETKTVQIPKLDFSKLDGLVTAVIQDWKTNRVLMVGFMNEEAWAKTLSTGKACFYSRSRNKLWLKGESSGHFLEVKEIRTDCDSDTLLLFCEAHGPGVCHEGYESCFFKRLDGANEFQPVDTKTYDPAKVYSK